MKTTKLTNPSYAVVEAHCDGAATIAVNCDYDEACMIAREKSMLAAGSPRYPSFHVMLDERTITRFDAPRQVLLAASGYDQ